MDTILGQLNHTKKCVNCGPSLSDAMKWAVLFVPYTPGSEFVGKIRDLEASNRQGRVVFTHCISTDFFTVCVEVGEMESEF